VLAQAPYFGQKFTLRDGGIRCGASRWPLNNKPPPRVPNAVSLLASGMRGALYTFRDPQDHQGQLKQHSYDQDAHEESHDSRDEIYQPLRRRLLHAQHDAGDNRDSAGEDGDEIQ